MDSKHDKPKCTGPPLAALEAAEREAIGKAITRQRPELEGYFRKAGLSDWEIDDAVADTFDKVWLGEQLDVESLHDPKNIRTVVFTAAGFVLGNVFKAREKQEQYDDIALDDRDEHASADDLHATAEFHDLQAADERARASLPPQQGEMLRLFREGYKKREIAALLGVKVSTVKEQLRRAHQTVRKRLLDEGFSPDELRAYGYEGKDEEDD